MSSISRVWRTLTAATITAAALSAPAQAGTYDAWSCRTPSNAPAAIGDASSGWQPGTTGQTFIGTYNTCANGGYLSARFTKAQPYGAGGWWRFIAPDHTEITGYEVFWSGFGGGASGQTSWVGDVTLQRSDQLDPNYVARRYGGGAFGSSGSMFADSNRVTQAGLHVDSLTARAGCSPGYNGQTGACPDPAAGADTSMFRLYRSRVTLQDSTAPSVQSITGDSLAEGSFSGEEVFSVNASDTGAGVYRLIVNVDGEDTLAEVINPDDGRCVDVDPSNDNPYEFVLPQPCPLSNSGDVVIDTTELPEGDHALRIKIEDASGNKTTVWGPAEKTVDNVPPPAPVDPDGDGPATASPTVAGVAKEGNTLVADPGAWSGDGVTFAYAWERCDSSGANCATVAGATGKTHTLTAADVGKRLRVVVTATNGEGSTKAASSPTGVVLSAGCAENCATPSTAGGTGATGAGGATGPVNGVGASANARVTAAFGSERTVRTRYGKRVTLTGRVVNEHGAPITNAVLDVLERPRGDGGSRVVGTVTTASDGTFSYLLPVGGSRVVRFAYRYRTDAADYTHTSEVDVFVKARVAFRATRRVSGRKALRFRGRLPGVKAGGIVLLQARVGSRWQIFQKARVRKNGTFRSRYVFRRTRVRTTFAFRAYYAGRDGSRLEPAHSRVRKVRYTP